MPYSAFKIAFLYIKHYLSSTSKFSVHSPFVYNFYVEALKKKNKNFLKDYATAKEFRKLIYDNKDTIEINSLIGKPSLKLTSIGKIARRISQNQKSGECLYRITKYFNPQSIVELGTGLGISTVYLHLANPESEIFTFEGNKQFAEIAKKYFELMKIHNVHLIQGLFNEELKNFLENRKKDYVIDLLFIDGAHNKNDLLTNINMCLPFLSDESVILIHDIHWSKDMEEAWYLVSQHNRVSISIDVFYFGILFLKQNIAKQHFKLRI